MATMRLPEAEWRLAERMTAERDAFGFYFSAHPVDAQRHLLAAHKVKRFDELGSLPAPAEGGRSQTMMAGMVEEARWRTSQRGRRYMMATISDPSGQFTAMAFDDGACDALVEAAKTGDCGLITAELDRKPGEEEPRVTVKHFKPLGELAQSQRLRLDIRLIDAGLLPMLSEELQRGGRGVVRVTVPVDGKRNAVLLLGRDFVLDADVADRLARLLGEDQVELSAETPARPMLAYSAAG